MLADLRPPTLLAPHFTRACLVRSIAAWAFMRVCIAGIGMIAAVLAERPPPEDPFAVTGGTALLIVAMVAGGGVLFARLRHEERFLLTLGYGPVRTACVAALPPAALELAAWLAR